MRRSVKLTWRSSRMFDEQAFKRVLGRRHIPPCPHSRVELGGWGIEHPLR